jgi:hypothetical protein
MLQIFNADSTCENFVPLTAREEQSDERSAETISKTLAGQLHAETENRFFLEEAIDLLDFKVVEDSSSLMNVLNLLNRTAGTRQILIADRDGRLIESSFVVGREETELSIGTVTWLIDQADRAQQRSGGCKPSISRLTLDQEILTMPLACQLDAERWMIVIGDPSEKRGLKDQASLFQSARRLLERLIAAE